MQFVLVVDEPSLAPWHLPCLERLRDAASLAAVVVAGSRSGGGGGPRRPRDAAAALVAPTVDLESALPGVPRVSGAEIAALGPGERPDFALMLGRGPSPQSVEDVARHGLWRFQHELAGDERPFFDEVNDGD